MVVYEDRQDWMEGPGSQRVYLSAETAKTLATATEWAAGCLNYKVGLFGPMVLHTEPNCRMFAYPTLA